MMLISELIIKLEAIKQEHGDLPVFVPSFEWGSEDGFVDDFDIRPERDAGTKWAKPKRLEISFSGKR